MNKIDQTAGCSGHVDLVDLYIEYELRKEGLEVHRSPGRVSKMQLERAVAPHGDVGLAWAATSLRVSHS